MKIEGYFSGYKNSNMAVEKLKKEGYRNVKCDITDHYSNETNYWENNANSSGFSLTSAVLNPNSYISGGGPWGPIGGAAPIISGISPIGGGNNKKDNYYKVVVDAEPMEEEKVKQMMFELGGDVRDPNFRR